MAGLNPAQRAMALRLITLAERQGHLSPARAREFAAAAFSESGLDPHAHNPSGADGLFQLLSSGYRTRAQKLGGVYNPQANALAILPDYVSYWKGHPKALPGDAGRDVERSGEGSGFYSKGLSMMPDGMVAPPQGPHGPLHPAIAQMMESHAGPDLNLEALSGLQAIMQGDYNPLERVGSLSQAIEAAVAPTAPQRGLPESAPAQTPQAPNIDVSKLVHVSPGADRKGVPTNPAVIQFVGKIAQLVGSPLTIGTGSNHHQYVSGEGNTVSDHWYGEAADIPAAGDQLTRLGQDALIAAGADPKWARHQKGGVYNIGGYNILFNTHVGGNHFNHLHVGLGRILGRGK